MDPLVLSAIIGVAVITLVGGVGLVLAKPASPGRPLQAQAAKLA